MDFTLFWQIKMASSSNSRYRNNTVLPINDDMAHFYWLFMWWTRSGPNSGPMFLIWVRLGSGLLKAHLFLDHHLCLRNSVYPDLRCRGESIRFF